MIRMETIAYLKNEARKDLVYSVTGELSVTGNGRFWHNITSWAADHKGQPGWYVALVVVDNRPTVVLR